MTIEAWKEDASKREVWSVSQQRHLRPLHGIALQHQLMML